MLNKILSKKLQLYKRRKLKAIIKCGISYFFWPSLDSKPIWRPLEHLVLRWFSFDKVFTIVALWIGMTSRMIMVWSVFTMLKLFTDYISIKIFLLKINEVI